MTVSVYQQPRAAGPAPSRQFPGVTRERAAEKRTGRGPRLRPVQVVRADGRPAGNPFLRVAVRCNSGIGDRTLDDVVDQTEFLGLLGGEELVAVAGLGHFLGGAPRVVGQDGLE